MNPSQVPTITVDQLAAGALVLDVREDEEWAAGHIDGATHVPMFQVPDRVAYDAAAFASEQPIVVVCKMGGRSAQVTAWLNHNGIEAVNLEGGMLAWAAAHRPMVADGALPPHVF